jgi:hypothetical protein
MSVRTLVCLVLCAAVLIGQESRATSRPAPPIGGAPSEHVVSGLGLAATYPGDRGVRSDSRVLFADDFESNPSFATWTQRGGVVLTSDDAKSGGGAASLVVDPKAERTSWLYKRLPQGQDRLFVRFYVKFSKRSTLQDGVAFLTGDSGRTWDPYDRLGVCPDGCERFMTGVGPFGEGGARGGAWRLHSAWCDMSIDADAKHPPNAFRAAAPEPVARRDVWTCVEFMFDANSTPSTKDGEQAFWIDGNKGARFEGLRWRTHPRVKANGVWLSTRVEAGDGGAFETLYDDLVVATDYVGPRVEAETEPGSGDGSGDGAR